MRREGNIAIGCPFAAHEDSVRDSGVVVVRVGSSSPLIVACFNRTRNRRSAFWSRQSSLGFGRMVDEVAMGPFRTAGETSEKTWPGENRKKCETSEKEDGCVENEETVVERLGLNSDCWSGCGVGGRCRVNLVIRTRRHLDPAVRL